MVRPIKHERRNEIWVRPSTPFKAYSALIEYAKTNKIDYATAIEQAVEKLTGKPITNNNTE